MVEKHNLVLFIDEAGFLRASPRNVLNEKVIIIKKILI
jgi:hypothetical protein